MGHPNKPLQEVDVFSSLDTRLQEDPPAVDSPRKECVVIMDVDICPIGAEHGLQALTVVAAKPL